MKNLILKNISEKEYQKKAEKIKKTFKGGNPGFTFGSVYKSQPFNINQAHCCYEIECSGDVRENWLSWKVNFAIYIGSSYTSRKMLGEYKSLSSALKLANKNFNELKKLK